MCVFINIVMLYQKTLKVLSLYSYLHCTNMYIYIYITRIVVADYISQEISFSLAPPKPFVQILLNINLIVFLVFTFVCFCFLQEFFDFYNVTNFCTARR